MKRLCAQINFFILSFFFFLKLSAVHVTPDFGKTHFIVGADSAELIRQKKVSRLQNYLQIPQGAERIIQAFFAPDDDTRSILLRLIECEKEKIYFAAYLLTDEEIAKAIIQAHQRGVQVFVVADKFCCRGKYGKVRLLHDAGIEVLVYKSKQKYGSKLSDIMHNKFVVFHCNLLDRSIVWTGSLNFTHSARLRNQENVLLVDEPSVVEKYVQQFAILQQRSTFFDAAFAYPKIEKLIAHRKKGNQKWTVTGEKMGDA